jgi:hypothetical protein
VYTRLAPGATGSGLPVLVTERSALAAPTVVVVVPLSLPGFGSVVEEEAVAVLVITVPGVTEGPTFTVSVKAVLPGTSEAMVQDTVPAAPAAGVAHDQPAGVGSETNVVPAGRVSLSDTEAALLGPPLVTVIV